MTRKPESERNEVGMELKYCEHCGGLWVRERGAGIVYCDKCQAKVAALPAPKKRKNRLILPVRPHTAVEKYEREVEEEEVANLAAPDLEALEFDASELDARDFEADGAA
jgi:ribosomal protein L37AE/L43A